MKLNYVKGKGNIGECYYCKKKIEPNSGYHSSLVCDEYCSEECKTSQESKALYFVVLPIVILIAILLFKAMV